MIAALSIALLLSLVTTLALVGLVADTRNRADKLAAERDDLVAARDADGYQALVGRSVIANVTDGGSIRGVLSHVYRDAIVLAHPEWVSGARPAAIGGEITLDRDKVPMLQRFDAAPVAEVPAIGKTETAR